MGNKSWLGMVASVVSLLLVVVVGVRFWSQAWPPLRVAGAVLGVFALGMGSVARWQLGRSFSVRARALQLVTTGIYARLRNPIYVAGELFFVAWAMFVPSWWPLVIVVVTVPLQMKRAANEAEVLRAAFGEEYERYRRGTWF